MDNELCPAECDVVMEGGITSGVVYPSFIASLSKHFQLRSIGGASVGAIAAVAAAAAQFRRNTSAPITQYGGASDPFATLGTLGNWLQDNSDGKTNLLKLFQPCKDLKLHFDTLIASLNAPTNSRAAMRFLKTMMLNFRAGLVVAAIVIFMMYALAPQGDFGWVILATAWAAVGWVLGSLAQFLWSAWRGLRANRFGICSGLRAATGDPLALTEWMHEYIQDLSGLPKDKPLTFGQLRNSNKRIELVLMTTGVSELTAHQLPYTVNDLVFRRSDLLHLFPETVIDWLVRHESWEHSDKTIERLKSLESHSGGDLRDFFFMPSGDDLPVIVAARMSLSFPILLQAVPLMRIRHYRGDIKKSDGVGIKTVWFSDGGLTNNFPIHLFDQLLPSRPTFGVVLSNTLRDNVDSPTERVELTENNSAESSSYVPIGDPSRNPDILRFFVAMIATIRSWRHEALRRTPGFRDRVVIIKHTAREGGLNLNMPPDVIARMSASGAEAAARIVRRFCNDDRAANGWINHRFVRMRTTAALLHNTLLPVARGLTSNQKPSYAELWAATGSDQLHTYQLDSQQREEGVEFFRRLVHATTAVVPGRLNDDGPKPMPSLVIAPRER